MATAHKMSRMSEEDALEIAKRLPPMLDLSADNITQNVYTINSFCPNPRLKWVIERVVTHLNDFARETRLSSEEWMLGLEFLTKVGHTCTDVRQEFILLSDILGLSHAVDSINHPKPPESTEGTLLGPFHTHDAQTIGYGDLMSHDPEGEPMLIISTVRDTAGRPIEGVLVDIWETDSRGLYDTQYEDRDAPDGRCVIKTDQNGNFWLKGIKPVPYPIPHDGPVGKLLSLLHRHPYRPSHIHFMFKKEGFDNLITALFLRGDPFEASDAVFGVKTSLLVELGVVDDALSRQYGIPAGSKLLRHDFVLGTNEECEKLRIAKSKRELAGTGLRYKWLKDLPIPDID